MDNTKITAKLPHLDVEMTRVEPSDGQPEVITLKMTATPSNRRLRSTARYVVGHFIRFEPERIMSTSSLRLQNTNQKLFVTNSRRGVLGNSSQRIQTESDSGPRAAADVGSIMKTTWKPQSFTSTKLKIVRD